LQLQSVCFMKYLLIVTLYVSLYTNMEGQKLMTTKSGQSVYIMSDGTWKYHQSEVAETSITSNELPYKPFMTPELIGQLRSVIKEIELKEVLAFMVLDSLNKEKDHKKMKISQSKRLKNKLEQKQSEKELKTVEKAISLAESNYNSASIKVEEVKKLRLQEYEDYLKDMNIITQELNIPEESNLILQAANPEVKAPSPEGITIKKSKPIPADCIINKDVTEGKNRTLELKKEYLFSYTPEKLKSYFKDKDLMVTDIAVITEKNITKLRLFQKLISKDASKNYGHIPFEALMRISLISGKKIDIYSLETSYGEVENYTGSVIYKTDFLLKDSDVKALSEVPVDTIGIMWTSGFESYAIYNIDVIMKQLSCIKRVIN
jgi:hypothetical protein